MDDFVPQFLDGKSVALIGNALSLMSGSEYGELIDNHDVVVRFNNGYVRRETMSHSGEKCNIWVAAKKSHKIFNKWAIRWQHVPMWIYFWYEPYPYLPQINRFVVDPIYLRQIGRNIGVRPTTGFAFITYCIEKTSPKYINLFGFDFFKTPSISSARSSSACHNPTLESKLVNDYLKTNKISIYL